MRAELRAPFTLMARTLPHLNLSGSSFGPWPALLVTPGPRVGADPAAQAEALSIHCLARWTIEVEGFEANQVSRCPCTVRVLRVHPRLMCLLCYCEDSRCIRSLSWTGLRQVREAASGRLVDLPAWIADYVSGMPEAHPRAIRHSHELH